MAQACSGTHIITVRSIYDHGKNGKTLWEVWAEQHLDLGGDDRWIIPHTYYVDSPFAVDEAELAMRQGWPLRVQWVDCGWGHHIETCEVVQEARTA